MLYVNLLDDGSHQVMERVTEKGNAYLVPFTNTPDERVKVNPDKKWDKKIFAYLRLPPISAKTREKLFRVQTGETDTETVKEWTLKLNRQEQGLYVAVGATYPPRLYFNLKHLGDKLTDEQLQELMDSGQEHKAGPDGEEILLNEDWNLMSDSPSAIATLLDPIYVQCEDEADHVAHRESNEQAQASENAKAQEFVLEQKREEMALELDRMREELGLQEAFVAKEKGQVVTSDEEDAGAGAGAGAGEPWITYNEESDLGKEANLEDMDVEDRQRLLIKAGGRAVLAVEDNKLRTTVNQTRYAGLLQEVPSTPIDIPVPETGEESEEDHGEDQDEEPLSTEVADDDSEGQGSTPTTRRHDEGQSQRNRPHATAVTNPPGNKSADDEGSWKT